jgi:menaquinol-cytochrome c reductase iron-sulfur subunit
LANNIPRRAFLARITSLLGATWAAILAIPGAGFLLSPVLRRAPSRQRWVDLKLPPALEPNVPVRLDFQTQIEDGWMTRKVRSFVYIAKLGDQIVAFSPTCTHLGCKVSWSSSNQRFMCPCHGGVYDLNGSVVAGPPPRPLARLPVEIEADNLRVEVSGLV